MTERPTLVIANYRYSSWSMRPWLLMRHFEIAFNTHRLALRSEQFQRQVGEYSPSRRLPALIDGEIQVWDSLAICEHVNERYLGGVGWPSDFADRAQARSLAAEMHAGFADLKHYLPMNLGRPVGPPKELGGTVLGDIERILAAWERCLEGGGPFLFGAFGIVDAMFAPVASRLRTYAIGLSPAVACYVAAIHQLPAFSQWQALALAESEQISEYEQA